MQQFLQDEYARLPVTTSLTGKANILNNIVQIKLAERTLNNFQQDFSLDVKAYILSLIDVAEMAPKNYDGIKKQKLEELFDQFTKADIPFYLDFLIRHLQKRNFEDEVEIFQKLKIKHEILRALETVYKPKDLFSFIINASLYNVTSLLITLFSLSTIICLALLPAPIKFFEFINFAIEYQKYTDDFFINHTTNIISYIAGANDDIKIVARDVKSAYILIGCKIFAYVYVSTLVLNKLSDIIKR